MIAETVYKPIEMPSFLLKAISSQKKTHFINDSKWTYLYVAIWLAYLLLFSTGFLFEIRILFIVGLLLLVFKIIFNLISNYSNRYYWEAIRYVKKELKYRSVISKEDLLTIWKTKERLDIAKRITSICIEQIAWDQDTIFLPDDQFRLMIELFTGDLCKAECIMAVEKEFSIKFPKEYFYEENPGDLKFKGIVNYISVIHKIPTPTRKRLKGVASGLTGKFTSRYNTINGYWGLGILYKLSNEAGSNFFKLDILTGKSNHKWKNSGCWAQKYKTFLMKQLYCNNLTLNNVKEAAIEVNFNIAITKNIPKDTWGEPYSCRAVITDDLNKNHVFESYGFCGIHNPQNESSNNNKY